MTRSTVAGKQRFTVFEILRVGSLTEYCGRYGDGQRSASY
jgi:hypothetical protein